MLAAESQNRERGAKQPGVTREGSGAVAWSTVEILHCPEKKWCVLFCLECISQAGYIGPFLKPVYIRLFPASSTSAGHLLLFRGAYIVPLHASGFWELRACLVFIIICFGLFRVRTSAYCITNDFIFIIFLECAFSAYEPLTLLFMLQYDLRISAVFFWCVFISQGNQNIYLDSSSLSAWFSCALRNCKFKLSGGVLALT